MDPLAAALCGLGATVLFAGGPSSSTWLSLFGAFYGVHRVVRNGSSKVLIGAPAAVWGIAHLWSFLPERLVRAIGETSPLVAKAPENLAGVVLLVTLVLMVAAARARIGAGLTTLTLVAIGAALLLLLVPSSMLRQDPGALSSLVTGTERGWSYVARALAGLCLLLIGIGPISVPALPRRGGALAGAVGAVLLAAGMVGLPHRLGLGDNWALVVLGLFWLAAHILSAVGLGAMARAGAAPAGWIGVGLVVLAIVLLVPSLAVFHKTDTNAYGFAMATPFGLLGIGVGLLGWKGAPFPTARKALGGAFVVAFVGGTLAWLATWTALANVVRAREPWALARLTMDPIATLGLVLWASLLVYLASPPTVPR